MRGVFVQVEVKRWKNWFKRLREKKTNNLFAGLWSVPSVKNCDWGVENAARRRRPRAAFLRPIFNNSNCSQHNLSNTSSSNTSHSSSDNSLHNSSNYSRNIPRQKPRHVTSEIIHGFVTTVTIIFTRLRSPFREKQTSGWHYNTSIHILKWKAS